MDARRIRSVVLLLAPTVAAATLSSCNAGGDTEARAQNTQTRASIVPVAPVAPSALSSTATTVATTTSTTTPATTSTSTTSTSSTSTTSTSTTSTSTTTTLPPTTTTTLPVNIIPAVWTEEPIPAVGGSSGHATSVVQLRLLQLGFWLSGVDGEYGTTTKQAVMAFQKYVGVEATGKVDEVTALLMTNLPERGHGLSDSGTLVEINKAAQLLFLVVDGRTEWVFNTSTANGERYEEPDQNTPGETISGVSVTPDGMFAVNRERPEGWWEGDLGEIYRPKYFNGGIALHGSNSVPNYPASHGCVRLSVQAMNFIWETGLVPLGTPVWVHSGAV